MKIGILSDSHDHLDNIHKAAQLFRERGVDQVLHAGDIISPPMVLALEGLKVQAVCGNNDGEVRGLTATFAKIGGKLEEDVLEVDTPEGKIAVYHGTYRAILDALIHSGKYLAVISGHTHKPVNRKEGTTKILNPGTAHGFGKDATVMVYDTQTDQADIITL